MTPRFFKRTFLTLARSADRIGARFEKAKAGSSLSRQVAALSEVEGAAGQAVMDAFDGGALALPGLAKLVSWAKGDGKAPRYPYDAPSTLAAHPSNLFSDVARRILPSEQPQAPKPPINPHHWTPELIGTGWAAKARYVARVCEALADLIAVDSLGEGATCNSDFTEVVWFGERYKFSAGNQAKAVGVLWTEWRMGKFGLHEKAIGEKIGSSSNDFRLVGVFRGRKEDEEMHPAWSKMIVRSGKGTYKLQEPKKRSNK